MSEYQKIELREDLKSRRGLAVSLEIICLRQLWRIDEYNAHQKISNKCYDVNLRLTYGMRAIGKGGAAARIFCGLMNLPPTTCKTVAVDGIKGYSSLNGVVCAMSIENGKVIDFEALTKYCSSCKGKKTM
ncbi:uncharacterized protein TNCV_1599111 [Trichonephila clavipes]|nr:uncharacterized protein TNCV_1599111 [Trichonephila clavipes]